MDQRGLIESFQDFASENGFSKSPIQATRALWLFFDETTEGKVALEDVETEKMLRKSLQELGWQIHGSPLFGEDTNYESKLGVL